MSGQRATMGRMDTRTPPPVAGDVAHWAEVLRRQGVDPSAVPASQPQAGLPESPQDARDRRRRQAEARAARWVSRLPVMYREATLADLDDTQHAQTIRDWTDDPGGATLLLAGGVGTGKTHAAYAVGHALVAQGRWVEAWTVADLLEALRPDGDASAREAVRDCDVLLLDDVTTAKVSDWAVEQFTSLMDHRLRMMRRQVVTTNATHPALVEAWGDRALDRLRWRWTVCQFVGESRRAGW